MNLFWNLEENATRRHILAETLLQLPEDDRREVRKTVDAAGIPDDHHHDVIAVYARIESALLPEDVKADMRSIYTLLAEAEAKVHGCTVEQTHFHEVGNGEALRNVAAICVAVRRFAPDAICATNAQTGFGTVVCAHGELDIPAPATAALIARGIPTRERTLPGERMTPTSAAVLVHYVDEWGACL